ncbi:MAG TPA: DUF4340 domain-containing protein [Acetobacteraceae bacterium]|nr:DUF4340 domain-containing protein [Acetobacteraceae bacterium]
MTPRTLLALVTVGVVALAGGWYFGLATTPQEQRSVDTGKPMFPGLINRLDKTAKIEIIHQGKPLVIQRNGDSWGLSDRNLYPVQETKLRGMLTALTELRLVEPRTSDPAQYSILGVEDPSAKDTTGTSDLLRLIDASGKPIAAVIVGHRRIRTQGSVPDQVYVRRPGARQSWLAEGNLQVDADPQVWLDRDIMNIDHAQVVRVVSTRGDSQVELARRKDKLVVQSPADHPKLDAYKLEDVARALELLTFEDVHKADGTPGTPIGHSVFTTSDGMTVTVTIYPPADAPPPKLDGQRHILVQFAVAGQGAEAKQAAQLEKTVAGWTYQLGAWKEQSLLPSIDTLRAPVPSTAAPHAPAAAANK